MAKLNLSSPWVIFYQKLSVMFKRDPEVRIVFDEDANEIKLYIENDSKASALGQLLPEKIEFGNVTLKIMVLVANSRDTDYGISSDILLEDAFRGNDAFRYVKVVEGIFSNPIVYVVFENCVVQYFNDNLGDAHGIASTLYQDIAKDIFEPISNVYYCTDLPYHTSEFYDSFGAPLGEWP